MKGLKLPYASHLVEIFEIDKIMNSRKKFSTVDKLLHLEKLRDALEHKLDMIKSGKVKAWQAKKAQTLPHLMNSFSGAPLESKSDVDELDESMEEIRDLRSSSEVIVSKKRRRVSD